MAQLIQNLGLDAPPARMWEALTHPSFANEQPDADPDNQRLEFLGDAVLSLCVSEQLMAAFHDVDEGTLTVMRASLVNAGALAAAARRLGLGEALRLGKGADAAGERHRTNVLADGMEAVVGAVYLHAGLDAARGVSRRIVGDALVLLVARGGIQRDPKSRLQELVQARGYELPRYDVVSVEGPPHACTFTVRVVVGRPAGELAATGAGRSKQIAEQEAARAALPNLEEEP